MSLLMLEGFDWLDPAHTGTMAEIQAQMQHKFGTLTLTTYGNGDIVAGRHDGAAVQFATSNAQYMFSRSLHDAETETSKAGVAGWAMKTGTTCIGHYLFVARRANQWNFNVRCLSATGEVVLYRSSNTYVGTFGYFLKPNSWYYFEVKWICKDSPNGEVYLRINGEDIGNFTGLDTYYGNASQTGWDNVGWYNCYDNYDHIIDDIYVCNQSGSINNNWLGDVIVRTRKPNGDVSVAFTRSGGLTNYENVDNVAVSDDWDDTSYVESGTSTQKDLYDYTNLETEDSSAGIVGASIESVCKVTDASSIGAKHKVKSGATEIGKTTQNFMWDEYGYMIDIQETDPNTGSAWTPTNFDATQFGIEIA